MSATYTVSGAGGIGIIGTGDDVDTGFGIDSNGEVFRLTALTGDFEDLLGVSQKAAHKTLIGAVSGNYREFFRTRSNWR